MGHDQVRKIVLDPTFPPVPTRAFDWHAYLDGYEPGDAMGHGATVREAVVDLLDQLEEQDYLLDAEAWAKLKKWEELERSQKAICGPGICALGR
jgi:NAD(P)H-hydrate repair Nnr-like enzyme with NAD(P)H-hydrate dehydratase domain